MTCVSIILPELTFEFQIQLRVFPALTVINNILYLDMRQFKWIISFLPAFLITLGLVTAFAYLDVVNNFIDRHITYYWIYHLFMTITCFSLFAFLSCYFVPAPKKYAGLLAVIISLSFIAFGLYMNFTDKYFQGNINIKFFINYRGIASGLSIGIAISYSKFKNKGWNILKNHQQDDEIY